MVCVHTVGADITVRRLPIDHLNATLLYLPMSDGNVRRLQNVQSTASFNVQHMINHLDRAVWFPSSVSYVDQREWLKGFRPTPTMLIRWNRSGGQQGGELQFTIRRIIIGSTHWTGAILLAINNTAAPYLGDRNGFIKHGL